ncbi:hypothetical protein E2C01_092653 [Portunus trituberculatus]|uniref:Uncharacterized protein n=1 Tax=Portunus trituberculatus TaxID=210409 RepID=A0A5B7JGZ5_PORTR|nr:hypothetical protein [Portunus trituberculatus]
MQAGTKRTRMAQGISHRGGGAAQQGRGRVAGGGLTAAQGEAGKLPCPAPPRAVAAWQGLRQAEGLLGHRARPTRSHHHQKPATCRPSSPPPAHGPRHHHTPPLRHTNTAAGGPHATRPAPPRSHPHTVPRPVCHLAVTVASCTANIASVLVTLTCWCCDAATPPRQDTGGGGGGGGGVTQPHLPSKTLVVVVVVVVSQAKLTLSTDPPSTTLTPHTTPHHTTHHTTPHHTHTR